MLFGIAGGPVARVGGPLPLIGGPLAIVGEVVALVGGPLPRIEVVLGPVQGGGASGQPGLGRLQRLLGLPGPRLGRPDPGVVDGQGGDPLALRLLDDLWARSASVREDDLACRRSCWNAWSAATPRVTARTPLACSIQIRLASACRNWATSSSRLASSTAVLTSSAVTTASAPNASTSPVRPRSRPGGIHIQGPDWLVDQPHRHAQHSPHLQLTDHSSDPVPDPLAL